MCVMVELEFLELACVLEKFVEGRGWMVGGRKAECPEIVVGQRLDIRTGENLNAR